MNTMMNMLMALTLTALSFASAGCVGSNPANRHKAIAVDSAGKVFPDPAPLPTSAAENHAKAFDAATTLDAKLAAAEAAARDPHLTVRERVAWADKAVRLALRHPTFGGGRAFAIYAALADEAREANLPLDPIFLNLGAAHEALTR